jgi:hypothetical protein
MKHTAQCIADQLRFEDAYHKWVEQWPNYCQTCGGEGVIEYQDCVTTDPYPMYIPSSEPCGNCVDMGHCPRCGAKESIEWYGVNPFCRACGWMDFGPKGYQSACAPSPYECYCWETDLADYLVEEWDVPYTRVASPPMLTGSVAQCPNDEPQYPGQEEPPINCDQCKVAKQCPYPVEPPMELDLGTEVEL